MASHYIAILPKSLKNPSAWSLLVSKYKDLRLQSLQMSPEAFSSTYDNEIKLPYERWEARLQNPNGYTIIAHQEAMPSRVLNGVSTESTAQPEGSRREPIPVTCTEACPRSEDQHLCLSHSEWSGTNTLICEDHLNSEPLKCHIVGVFVHPDFRCCGIGTRLMESVMELAKRVAKDSGAPEVLVRLSVHVANTKVIDFYRGLGFREKDAAGLDENWIAKPVDMGRRIVLDTGA